MCYFRATSSDSLLTKCSASLSSVVICSNSLQIVKALSGALLLHRCHLRPWFGDFLLPSVSSSKIGPWFSALQVFAGLEGSGGTGTPWLVSVCWARQEKKSTKINFRGPEIAGWGGGLPCEGVVWSKSSCPPSKVCFPLVSREGTWDVPGIFRGCPGPLGKKFVQNKIAHFVFPIGFGSNLKNNKGDGWPPSYVRLSTAQWLAWSICSRKENEARRSKARSLSILCSTPSDIKKFPQFFLIDLSYS